MAIEARRIADGHGPTGAPVERATLRRFDRPSPGLAGYDALLTGPPHERAGQRAGVMLTIEAACQALRLPTVRA